MVNLYYSNRTVQNAIELKNKRSIWLKAQSATLSSGQNEVKFDFPLPITACNIVLEFAEFYTNTQVCGVGSACESECTCMCLCLYMHSVTHTATTHVFSLSLSPSLLQASPEVLHCPRCGASVPAHPGVCGQCGENVFQCHKCR